MYVYCATESIGPVIEQKSADTLVESVPHETKYLLTATSSVCVCVCVCVKVTSIHGIPDPTSITDHV